MLFYQSKPWLPDKQRHESVKVPRNPLFDHDSSVNQLSGSENNDRSIEEQDPSPLGFIKSYEVTVLDPRKGSKERRLKTAKKKVLISARLE